MAILTDLEAENALLKAKIAELSARKGKGVQTITCKVSAKGAVSVYGLGRWPVTLYGTQWVTLLDKAVAIREFIAANQSKLATKDGDHAAELAASNG